MSSEPRNPFYFLLLAASLLFVATALAYGIFPVLEENALSMGRQPPPSAFRAALRTQGPFWLLYELGAMAVLVALCVGLDWRRWAKHQLPAPSEPNPQAPSASE